MLKQFQTSVLITMTLSLGACATIVGSSTQTIPISSTPSDASISITDESGVEIFKGTTPTPVTLQKSTGHYWGKKTYTVTISKAGFATQTIPITSAANGWYLAGNLVFGGLIGWFVVDPMSGNMYTLSPATVASSLPNQTALNNNTADNSIAVLLLQDVPANMRSKLVRVE